MTRTGRTAAAIATAALVALPLAGCGKDKPKIPRSDARALVAVLDTVKRQTDAHACTAVQRTLASLDRRVQALPSRTDADIRSSLRDGIANLRELVLSDCSQVKQKPDTTTEETTTSEPDTSTDTNTDTTTDTDTETTTETSPDTNTTPNTDTAPNTTPDTTPSGGASSPPGQGKKKGRAK
jgi:hypothetical protein